jgi:hypothetical protein
MEETATPAHAVTVKSLLIDWANGQDAWVRHLVSEVVVSGKAMTRDQLDSIYQTFLREKALVPGGPVEVPALSDDASSLSVSSGLFLTQLRDLKHVNALVEGQAIDFNRKLTVVFGENACGKTGYVRVLKKAAAVRTTETVLPNLSEAQGGRNRPARALRSASERRRRKSWNGRIRLALFPSIASMCLIHARRRCMSMGTSITCIRRENWRDFLWSNKVSRECAVSWSRLSVKGRKPAILF